MRKIALVTVVLMCLVSSRPPAALGFQQDAAQAKEAFLANTAGEKEFSGLAQFPELFSDRQVQMKLMRSLSSPEPAVFKAAMGLALKAPALSEIAVIKRRSEAPFVSNNTAQRKALLELAGENPALLEDLRILGVVSQALRDDQLKAEAEKLLQANPSLKSKPVIAASLPDPGSVKLPDPQYFKQNIEPLLLANGSDDKNCVSCHKTHPILQLGQVEDIGDPEKAAQEHYRNSLLVVDLANPEQSSILIKPTLAAPPQGQPESADTHGGGVRFEKGSEAYQKLLTWIQSAR